ncbi:MAG: metallophosphoesterase [Acidobacteria bacterium]|nr:metallophosphoesterase [Acidobacteriota bacterium]
MDGRPTRFLLVVCLASGAALMIDAFLVEPDWIEVHRSVEFIPAMPASQPDLTIVHLSDLHVGRFGLRERRALAMVNDARPDLILVSGDLTRRGATPADLERFLGALRSRYGNFAVWGSHDHRDGVATGWGPESLERAGFTLLRNSSVRLPRAAGRIHVAGLDDPASGHDNLSRAMARVPRRDVCILLSHTPEIVRYLGNWDIDLVFAGRTHGGQVRLPLLGAIWVPPGTRGFLEGWYDAGPGVRLHVSRGLGWSFLPARLLCRPRIDRITLRGGTGPGGGDGGRVTRRSRRPTAPA